jgi:hypothetical protein
MHNQRAIPKRAIRRLGPQPALERENMAESIGEQLTRLLHGVEPAEFMGAVLDGVAAALDFTLGNVNILSQAAAVPGAGGVEAISGLVTMYAQRHGVETIPNPAFAVHGIAAESTGITGYYVKHQTKLATASKAVSGASAGISFGTAGVSFGEAYQYGSAVTLSAIHIGQLKAIAKKFKVDEHYSTMIDFIIRMKATKAGVAGGKFAGAVFPNPFVGLVTGVAGAVLGIADKVRMHKVCLCLAADLHWRAYQESVMGGKGPATAIMTELFIRRGITGTWYGQHPVKGLIKDPCGWMAITDKLLLY